MLKRAVKTFLFSSALAVSGFSLTEARITYYGSLQPGGFIVVRSTGIEKAFLEGKRITSDEGFVVFGFDRDDLGSRTLELLFSDGQRKKREFFLPEREYAVQHVRGLPPEQVTPGPKERERIEGERRIIRQAIYRAGLKNKPLYSSGFMRPVKGGRITGVFGSQRILNGVKRAPHNGIDIALPQGTPVKAMADGMVLLTGDFFYAGKYVMLSHGQGLLSFYMHLSEITAEDGDFVKKGEKIGKVGMTGRATGPHLHWGVQWNDKRIDPASLLNTGLGEEKETSIEVDIKMQRLYLYRDGKKIKSYPVSTSRYGVGNRSGSFKTPPGLHRIQKKIGEGAAVGAVFRGRVKTGEITEIYYDNRRAGKDYILTRILRLEGLEPGVNKGEGIDSFQRYIYIHGTKEEGLVGQPVSRGCIRMRNKEVIELFELVTEGTPVKIIQ